MPMSYDSFYLWFWFKDNCIILRSWIRCLDQSKIPERTNIKILADVTYISAGIQLYKSPEGGQLKNQQPSKSPSSASAQKRAFSSCCGTKGMCGNASQRHSFISWLSKHPQRNIWILMCTLSLICLWNMNINLGKRGLISNRALTWNV